MHECLVDLMGSGGRLHAAVSHRLLLNIDRDSMHLPRGDKTRASDTVGCDCYTIFVVLTVRYRKYVRV